MGLAIRFLGLDSTIWREKRWVLKFTLSVLVFFHSANMSSCEGRLVLAENKPRNCFSEGAILKEICGGMEWTLFGHLPGHDRGIVRGVHYGESTGGRTASALHTAQWPASCLSQSRAILNDTFRGQLILLNGCSGLFTSQGVCVISSNHFFFFFFFPKWHNHQLSIVVHMSCQGLIYFFKISKKRGALINITFNFIFCFSS